MRPLKYLTCTLLSLNSSRCLVGQTTSMLAMMRKCTCAGLGLGQGQDVKVVHTGLVSDDDFASIVGGPHIAATGSRAVERGFAGTALADIPYAALPQLHQS